MHGHNIIHANVSLVCVLDFFITYKPRFKIISVKCPKYEKRKRQPVSG